MINTTLSAFSLKGRGGDNANNLSATMFAAEMYFDMFVIFCSIKYVFISF
jgi:hypothetical protein